jgi:hypothetical protein
VVKAPSPLLGFNNNVRHKGRVFHIQTEDSGIRHPHIITHLFADGGRILKSIKTSYDEHLGRPGMAETVRGMMQEQHKAMFIALRDGQYDYLFDESAPNAAAAPASPAQKPPAAPAVTPPPLATPAAASMPAATPAVASMPAATPAVASIPAATPPAPPPISSPEATAPSKPSPLDLARRGPPSTAEQPAVMFTPAPAPPAPAPPAPTLPTPPPADETSDPASRRRGSLRPTLQVNTEALHARDTTSSTPQVTLPSDLQPPRETYKSGIDLDLDALERAAVEAQTPFFQQINDLPPPPAAVLGKKHAGSGTSGSYSAISLSTPAADPGSAATSPLPRRSPPPAAAPAPIATGSTGRYAASRPAAIFATRPTEGASIFGEDLISEKSLDEVILSYLAEDLESSSDKK